MRLAPYREVLSVRGVAALLLFGLVFRVPFVATSVVLTLHVVTTLGRGYAAAGVVGTVLTLGGAVGQPWRGRAVDRVGLRRALLPGVLVSALMYGAAAFVDYGWLLVVVLVGGLVPMGVFTITRQVLAALVDDEQRRVAYSLDSMSTELSFMAGPALGVLVATHWSTRTALLVVGAGTVVSGLALMLFDPPTRREQAADADPAATAEGGTATATSAATRMPWSLALVGTLAAAAASGVVLAGTDVSIVAFARADDALGLTGLVFVGWGFASMAGAVVYGGLHRRIPVAALLLGLGLLTVPVGLVHGTPALALAILPAGVLCAPVITATADTVAALVPGRALGEAMGWHASALTTGSALGAPLAGLATDVAGSAAAGFAVVGLLGAVLALAMAAAARVARRRPSPVTAPAS